MLQQGNNYNTEGQCRIHVVGTMYKECYHTGVTVYRSIHNVHVLGRYSTTRFTYSPVNNSLNTHITHMRSFQDKNGHNYLQLMTCLHIHTCRGVCIG